MATIANLVAKFSADTGGFTKGVGKVRGSLRGLAGAAAAAAGSVGIGAIVKASFSAADQIQKMRDATGASTEFLSGLRFVSSQVGSDVQTMAKSITRMSKTLDDAENGLSTATRAFEDLGLSVEDLQKLSPDEQFRTIIEALSKVRNQAKFTAAGIAIFGKGFTSFAQLARGGAAAYDQLQASAEKANQVLGDDQVDAAAKTLDAVDKLSKTWGGLIQQLTLELAPALLDIVNLIGDTTPRALQNLFNGINAVGGAIGQLVAGSAQLVTGNTEAGRTLGTLPTDFIDRISGRELGTTESNVQNAIDRELVALQREANQKLQDLVFFFRDRAGIIE